VDENQPAADEPDKDLARVVRFRMASTCHSVRSSPHQQRLGAAGVSCSLPRSLHYIDVERKKKTHLAAIIVGMF